MSKNCPFFLKKRSPTNGSHRWETISESAESVERNVYGLCQTDIRIHLRDKSFHLWDPFEGEKRRYYPICQIRVPHVSVHVGDYFPLKGNNFPLIEITFGHDRIPSTEEIFHFNGSVYGILFSVKVKQFSVNRNHFRTS